MLCWGLPQFFFYCRPRESLDLSRLAVLLLKLKIYKRAKRKMRLLVPLNLLACAAFVFAFREVVIFRQSICKWLK